MDEHDRSWNALICLVLLNPKDLFSLVFSQPAAEPTQPIKAQWLLQYKIFNSLSFFLLPLGRY